MSSAFHVLCLSHDPAMRADTDEFSREEAVAAARHPDRHESLAAHRHCDLVVGRYSYPLVEVGCPPCDTPAGHHHPHDSVWMDAKWLRLLLAVSIEPQFAGTQAVEIAASLRHRCWSLERLIRLRDQLGIEVIDKP